MIVTLTLNAAGTAAALRPGTELCHRREVDILLPRVGVETIAQPSRK